jgi:hypothetical protein
MTGRNSRGTPESGEAGAAHDARATAHATWPVDQVGCACWYAPVGLADSELVCDALAANVADTLGDAVNEPLAVTVEDGVGVGVPVLLGELLPDSLGLPVPVGVPLGDADTDAEGELVPAVSEKVKGNSAGRVAEAQAFSIGVPPSRHHDRR